MVVTVHFTSGVETTPLRVTPPYLQRNVKDGENHDWDGVFCGTKIEIGK